MRLRWQWGGLVLAVVWLGMPGGTRAALEFFNQSSGLPHPGVTAVAVQGELCWVGTIKGLAFRRGQSGKFVPVPKKLSHIVGLALQGESLWVASEQGLYRLPNVPESSTDLPAPVFAEKIWSMTQDLHGRLWVGTETKLLLQAGPSEWRTFNLPENTPGPVRSLAPSGSVCYVGAGSSDLLILDINSRRWLLRSPPEVKSTITAIAVFGSQIWVGTDGQGFFRFDWIHNQWERLFSAELGKSFVMAGIGNGSYAWFGTFYGLVQMDMNNHRFTRGPEGLPEGGVNAFCLDGNRLWIGTEFGLAAYPLPMPRVALEPENTAQLTPTGSIPFRALAYSDNGLQDTRMDFAIGGLGEVWFERFLSHDAPDSQGRMNGEWTVADVPNPRDFYWVRIRTLDNLGRTNVAIAQVILAPSAPAVFIDTPETPLNSGLDNITGHFDTPFASEVRLNPGQANATLDREGMSFTATLNLVQGANNIRAELTDWFGRKSEAQATVMAQLAAPEKSIQVTSGEKNEEILRMNEVLLFDSGSADLKAGAVSVLNKVADYLNRDPALQAKIVGHTDNVPIHNSLFFNNQSLSKARAKSVFTYLIEEKEIGPERISILGLGAKKPLADNRTEAGRARNRRVEIAIKKME